MPAAVERAPAASKVRTDNGSSEDTDHAGLMKTRRATLLARIGSGKKGGWSAEWVARANEADSADKEWDADGVGKEGTKPTGKTLGGRYGNSGGDWSNPSRKLCGKTGIGLKGGIAHLVELLGRADSPIEPGTRLRAALTLEQLAEMEDAVVLIAAIGPGTAGPVARLFTGEVEGATVRERAAAAGILAMVAKLRRLKRAVAETPGLQGGLLALLMGEGSGPESQYAACKLLAEVGDVACVSAWAAEQPTVIHQVLDIAMCSLRGRIGLAAAEYAWLEVRAAGALHALAALCVAPASAALLVGGEEPRLAEVVELAGGGAGVAASALLSRLTEAEANHDALAEAEVAPALMERIRESEGDREALLLSLVGLRNLASHPPSAASIMSNHGSAMMSELLLFIRNEDDELLMPMLGALIRLAANEDNRSSMLHDGIILQLLPLLEHGSIAVAEEVARLLARLASTASCSRSIVGTGGIALLVARLLDEETPPPTSLRVAVTDSLVRLSALPENRSPIARLSLATLVGQVALTEDREVQAVTCRCLAVMATSSELKDAFLSIGLVDRLLNLVEDCRRAPHEGLMLAATEALYQIASDSDKPLGEQTELGAVAIGGHYVARAATRALMEELTCQRRSNPADIMAWMQEMGSPDRQEAALRVVSKMPAAAVPAMMAAETELVASLVSFLSSWHMPLRAVAANALARVAQSGQPARAAILAAGAAPLLVQMLQMQTAETRVPGTRLMQKLADEEEAREMLVDAGAIEALLDQIEHAPDSEGRISAAKALTNLSLSDACRSVMTPRGLQPLVEMLRPEVSDADGQQAALRALQNMSASRENAAIILKAAIKPLTELIQYSPISVKVAGAKLAHNIACHQGLDLALAPSVIPVIDELLMQQEIKVVQVACQLIDCLTQRPHLRHTWQNHDVSDRLIKILLLGDAAGRYYAAQALDKLGTELSQKLSDRKEAALSVDPAILRSASSTEVRKPGTSYPSAMPSTTYPTVAEESSASSIESASPSKSMTKSSVEPQREQRNASSPSSSLRRPLQSTTAAAARPSSPSTPKGGAISPQASSLTNNSSPRSSIPAPDPKSKPTKHNRPSSPLLRGEAKRVAEPSGPVEPKFGVGWEHRGASLRPSSSDGGVMRGQSRRQLSQRDRHHSSGSVDGVAIHAALEKLAVPGMCASLASMTVPGRLSSTEHRTTRRVKTLWTDVKSVAKVLGLKNKVTGSVSPVELPLSDKQKLILQERDNSSPQQQSGRRTEVSPALLDEVVQKFTEGASVMPAHSEGSLDKSTVVDGKTTGLVDSSPPGTPEGRDTGGADKRL